MKLRQLNLLLSVLGIAAIMALAACGTAQKQETAHSLATATGTRGGGEVVITANGQQQLRDLTEKTNCTWETGKNVAESLPTFESIADAASKHHWSYGPLLKRGAASVGVCFTEGNLIKVDATDLGDSLAIVEENGKQVAIRYNYDVYIDNKIWVKLDQKQKSYLFTHEILHSFLSYQEKQRNQKLRSAVSTLIKNSQIDMDSETFEFNMVQNKIDFGSDSQKRFRDLHKSEFLGIYLGNKYEIQTHGSNLLCEAQLASCDKNFSGTDVEPYFTRFETAIVAAAIKDFVKSLKPAFDTNDSEKIKELIEKGLTATTFYAFQERDQTLSPKDYLTAPLCYEVGRTAFGGPDIRCKVTEMPGAISVLILKSKHSKYYTRDVAKSHFSWCTKSYLNFNGGECLFDAWGKNIGTKALGCARNALSRNDFLYENPPEARDAALAFAIMGMSPETRSDYRKKLKTREVTESWFGEQIPKTVPSSYWINSVKKFYPRTTAALDAP